MMPLLLATLVIVGLPASAASPDVTHGKQVYQLCQSCHSVDENDVGPLHRGLVGRRAGSIPDYAYSKALKNSTIVWTAENLERWLQSPQAMVPGTKMFFRLGNAQDRLDVIAYLESLAAPAHAP